MGEGDEEVTYQSGLSRLCNAFICAFCVAPVLIIVSLGICGWNERRSVCRERAIFEGEASVVPKTCSETSGTGELVLFHCDLKQDGLAPLSPGGDFGGVRYIGTGLSTTVEMLQCVEHKHSRTEKDTAGGGQTTITTYTYSVEWQSSYINSGSFHSNKYMDTCGASNPAWPTSFPASGTKYATNVSAGDFKLSAKLIEKVPLVATLSNFTVPGWTRESGTYTKHIGPTNNQNIGDVRVTLMGTDWNNPLVTVLGQNNAGTIGEWTASDTWLCSGFTMSDLRMGQVVQAELFQILHSENNALTWVLRILGICFCWFAFSRLFVPLQVAAECIPCVGPCLGEGIEAITCCISCLPGTACSLGVIGIVWVAMRPMVGIPLLVVFFCTCGGYVGYYVYRKQQPQDEKPDLVDAEQYGNAA